MIKLLKNIFIVLFVVLTIVFFFWQAPMDYFSKFVVDNSILSIFVFIFLMVLSTVFEPLVILPIVPAVGVLLGQFETAIYSIIGWFIGSAIAFWIARGFGRPILMKFISEKDVVKYHKYLPEDIGFWWVVFLRMVIPVDVISYLIGLLTNMKMGKYLLASFIGIIPFSFIFAYGYKIVLFDNVFLTSFVSIFLITAIILIWYFKKIKKF
ncbi:TPA: hypothetical protein DCZ46_00315 [Candidatus Campbellbacteria bacterium]|nr:MAG: hypothetical protein UR58_C0001G0052 [Candidatus Campbellbacteria bacterium GW2011_OD1_34_28]KKP75467.1 MAG: hypothetical protein UR74_C0001G0323 [Candidatus Campbellbacteria bacterium GW2011_GWD2_35_24]KKP75972.1 MAG: hypothetical protein UR75_C0001G0006 [Candidatus Campbellbacteria bacterium GW2011_GWC2_35_28]KKP77161.1 MAG: hypothetical protein UR76_C0001G0006 [Candidatus Campbellbacteria bacterium GW2011_GWC1_35_31]KKP79090.1 MAG: hypothetical protein UR79_C0001G0006 [Candidatus Cam